ncbi:MAG: ABC transporter permease subunit [Anaerolineae bacterium]|nr:ABC transporter permease subunit [Anaerolineae bacterium]
MSNNALREYAQVAAPPLWRDIRFLRVFGQAIFVIAAVILIGWFASNTQEGLRRTGLLPTFDFLDRTSQFQIDEGLVSEPHSAEDTYGHAFLIGTINTLRVIVIGLVLTSILGLLMGLARLSTNWLIRQIAVVYIEVMQNTPLLVQLFFLYSGVFLLMPSVREAVQLPGPSYLSIRGFATPALWPTDTTGIWTLAVIISAVIGWLIWRRRSKVQLETGRPMYGTLIGIGIVIIVAVTGWVVLNPYIVSVPRIVGPRYASGEGSIVSPEFTAIVAGLVLYTSAFVAEIVRSGIQAVPTGQWEAARAQGFSYPQILRLIVLPQALRVMIPPLTNQYLNLIKNSSLGAAVGYQDLFSVSKTVFQSGQTIPTIIIVMTIYLVLDLFTSLVMNVLNARFQIKTR